MPRLVQYCLNIVGKILQVLEGECTRIPGAACYHIVGHILGVRHGLPTRGRIAFVVEQEVIEILGCLLRDRREDAEIHQQVTLRIKYNDFFLWLR